MTSFRRWELHWASVLAEETKGREQHNEPKKPRPWLIVSDNRIPLRERLVIVCPITTTIFPDSDPLSPFRVFVSPDMVLVNEEETGLTSAGTVLCDQIRAMSPVTVHAQG